MVLGVWEVLGGTGRGWGKAVREDTEDGRARGVGAWV